MDRFEAIRFISTITVIFIVLMLQLFYKKRFHKDVESQRVNTTGVVIVVISFLLAVIWMWKT